MRRADEGTLLELVGLAYEAGLGQKPWSVLLESLADVLGGGPTHILVHDELGCSGLVGAVRSDPDWRQRYLEHYSAINPYMSHPASRQEPGVVHSGEWLTRRDLSKTEFYNDFLRKQDVFPVLVANLFADRRRKGFLASYRKFHAKPYGAEERRLLRTLLPHVQRAIQITGVTAQVDLERSSLAASLDHLEQSVVLLDRSGTPVFVNRAARRLLTRERGLVVTRQGLRTSHPADSGPLASLLESAARTARCEGLAAGGCLVLHGEPGHRPLGLLVAPLPRRTATPLALADPSRCPAVIVFVADPEARPGPGAPATLIGPLFDLTPREAEVALVLASGLTIAETASRLQMTFHTARVHQRRIYEKMGVHSQAELVRRLHAVSPPLAAEP